MARYSDLIGVSTTATTGSFIAMTGSPYSPLKSGRLKKVKLYAGGDAVTSLIGGVVYVRLRSSAFGGVDVFVAIAGRNLETAPAVPISVGETECDVAVESGVPITAEIYQYTGATPVTPRFAVFGEFEG